MYNAEKYLGTSMISASKYQHIIYFMSLLKVSLCINMPKQRLLSMDVRRGCRSKRSPTLWKNKNFFSLYGGLFCYFFSMGRALCYVFLLMSFFFIVWRPFCYFFYVGAFLLRLPPGVRPFSQCGGLFHNVGAFFLEFVSLFGGTFLSSWGILCLYKFFLWGCPFIL